MTRMFRNVDHRMGCECPLPDDWPCLVPSMTSFLANDNLIFAIHAELSDDEDHQTNYLHIFNRMTHAWCSPIRLPDAYSDRLIRHIALVRPYTLVALCMKEHSISDTHTLVQFRISERLDALSIAAETDLGSHPFLACVGLHSSTNNTLRVVLRLTDDTQSGATGVHVVEGAARVSTVYYDIDATQSCVHDDALYLLAPSGLYRCNDDHLQLIPAYASGCSFTPGDSGMQGSLLETSARGGKITHCYACYYNDQTSAIITRTFDVSAQCWQPGIHLSITGIMYCNFWLVSECASDEALVGMGLRDCTDWKWINAYRSVWLQPPSLSTIALKAIHKRLPDETANKLERKQDIVNVLQFCKFLLSA